MSATTAGGAFRYPIEHTNYTEPLRRALRDAGLGEDLLEEWNALTMDRDRALEDYLTVAAAAVGSFFDAIVDGTLTTSDSANRIFQDIGEALIYLGSIGLNRVTIGVKPAGATAYQETANITSGVPAYVRIVGAGPHADLIDTPTTNGVVWDLRGRRIEFTNVTIENLTIRSSNALSNGATDLFNSSSLTQLALINCLVLSNSTFMNQLNGVSNDCRIYLSNTAMSNMAYGRARWVYHNGGDMFFSSTYTFTTVCQPSAQPTGGDMVCVMTGVQISGGSSTVSVTWNNTNSETVIMAGCSTADRGFVQLIPSTTRMTLTFVGRPSIDLVTAGFSQFTNVNFSAPSNGWYCRLVGQHNSNSADTTFTKSGTNYGTFTGTVSRLDVTGGARVDASLNAALGSATVILRGDGILADISIQSNTGSTAFQGIGLIRSCIRVAFHTFTTMNQAWTLDASSVGNICDFAGASKATNPGVDSGSANLVRQT
jgi:hypothetical protein